ncbi:MAG: hypothetical protein GX075_09045 [Firmicutes bacterium]|nr:hypothetical protein [Bacillota bacterium]
MRKPGILIFIIAFLLVLAGCLVYLAVSGPKPSTKAKLVDSMVKHVFDERGVMIDGPKSS